MQILKNTCKSSHPPPAFSSTIPPRTFLYRILSTSPHFGFYSVYSPPSSSKYLHAVTLRCPYPPLPEFWTAPLFDLTRRVGSLISSLHPSRYHPNRNAKTKHAIIFIKYNIER